jgi:hypothetical protein
MKKFIFCLFVAYTMELMVSCLFAQSLNFYAMPADINPIIDGTVTTFNEWSSANSVYNLQNTGTYYAENQQDWVAKSSLDNTQLYPGTTAFILHDLWGYTTSELADYNTFEFSFAGQKVKAWIFANGDESNDATWIGNSGLGRDTVDDRGFIVRLNDNPLLDRQWFPGDPEPGDSGWDWTNFYGFFGKAGFNDSAFQKGLPKAVDGADNEVYELALYGGTTGSPGGPLGVFTPCQTTLTISISDPCAGDPTQVQVVLIDGDAHINAVPEPSAFALLACGLLGTAGMAWLRRGWLR